MNRKTPACGACKQVRKKKVNKPLVMHVAEATGRATLLAMRSFEAVRTHWWRNHHLEIDRRIDIVVLEGHPCFLDGAGSNSKTRRTTITLLAISDARKHRKH